MDADAHRIPIPRRRNPLAQRGESSRGNIIVAAVMHKIRVSSTVLANRLWDQADRRQGAFFFLLQSEDGDLFKVTIEHENEDVRAMRIKYFDTVPVSTSLCILKSGYLFAASEFSDQ
jgi:splicing factor 3B subunit 3